MTGIRAKGSVGSKVRGLACQDLPTTVTWLRGGGVPTPDSKDRPDSYIQAGTLDQRHTILQIPFKHDIEIHFICILDAFHTS